MSTFTDHSIIETSWEQWRVVELFRFYHKDTETWIYDEIEEWFEFDWCSIPFCIFWQRIEPATLTPCCYHDRLVRYKIYWYWKSQFLFLHSMKVYKVKPLKRARYFIWVCLWCWITRYITWKTSVLNNFINKYLP